MKPGQCGVGGTGCMIRSAIAMASAENRKVTWITVCHSSTLCWKNLPLVN